MIDDSLLEMLMCPEDGSRLKPAGNDLIEQINRDIQAGTMKNRSGAQVTEPITEGLVREDGKWLYPVRDDILVMLTEEALPLSSARGE